MFQLQLPEIRSSSPSGTPELPKMDYFFFLSKPMRCHIASLAELDSRGQMLYHLPQQHYPIDSEIFKSEPWYSKRASTRKGIQPGNVMQLM